MMSRFIKRRSDLEKIDIFLVETPAEYMRIYTYIIERERESGGHAEQSVRLLVCTRMENMDVVRSRADTRCAKFRQRVSMPDAGHTASARDFTYEMQGRFYRASL